MDCSLLSIFLFLLVLHFYTISKHLEWFVIDLSVLGLVRTSMKNFQRVPEISIHSWESLSLDRLYSEKSLWTP
jgi:hypothetical protein